MDLGTADPVWKSYAPGYGLSAKSAWKRNRGNQEGDEDMKEVDWSSFFQRLDTLPERRACVSEAGSWDHAESGGWTGHACFLSVPAFLHTAVAGGASICGSLSVLSLGYR